MPRNPESRSGRTRGLLGEAGDPHGSARDLAEKGARVWDHRVQRDSHFVDSAEMLHWPVSAPGFPDRQ